MKQSFHLSVFLFFLIMITVGSPAIEAGSLEHPKIVYLDLDGCEVCDIIKNHGVLAGLEDQGIEIVVYDVVRNPLIADKYAQAYGVRGGRAAPIIFAGDVYFRGAETIIEAFESGEIAMHAQHPLRDIENYQVREFSFITGLLFVILAGLLDGINPCAIAMLLMFISMMGVTKKTKLLLVVTISYISAIFVTYFVIGVGFLTVLGLSRAAFGNISFYLYGFFFLLTTGLALLTLYDFWVTRKNRYDKVKNQLPRFIRAFNRRLMDKLTKAIDEDRVFKVFWLVAIPVVIGVLVGITEAACTGQIYIAVLASLEANVTGRTLGVLQLFYLFVFNLMFITPLIIIALIAIYTKNTISIANFVRQHLFLIKFLTALFFILMALYFLLLTLDSPWVQFEFSL